MSRFSDLSDFFCNSSYVAGWEVIDSLPVDVRISKYSGFEINWQRLITFFLSVLISTKLS